MGYARRACTSCISPTTRQWPEDFHGVESTYKQYLRQKRGIAKKLILTIRAIMIGQQVDLVAGDFTMERHGGAAAEAKKAPSKKPSRTVTCLHSWAQHRCESLGSVPNLWSDVCGFLKPPGSDREALGLRSKNPCCHHETWLHVDFVDWDWSQPRYEASDQSFQLEERPTLYHYRHRFRMRHK